jgi:alpha-amylase
MEKVAFLFCIHNHQPVGNFPYVLENAYEKAYRPFIEVFKRYPFIIREFYGITSRRTTLNC